MKRRYDSSVVGRQFGQFKCVRLSDHRGDNGRHIGVFVCANGKEHTYAVGRVASGATKKCSCTWKSANRKHGMRWTPEYSSWVGMKGRCLNPTSKDYPRWGGAGITVCDEWARSFEAFYSHIGPRPSGTTLERIDNTKGYEPGNVRWATTTEQASNRGNAWNVWINGARFDSVEAAARAAGVSDTTIVRWCDGYSDPRRSGKSQPPKHGRRRERRYQ